MRHFRGPASAAEVADKGNAETSNRLEKELYCAEKKCMADAKFWCDKKCQEDEAACTPQARQERLAEVTAKETCTSNGKFFCRGKCQGSDAKACPDLSKVDCNNLLPKPAATGATGATAAATGPTGPSTTTTTTTTTAAPAGPTGPTTTTTQKPEEEEKKTSEDDGSVNENSLTLKGHPDVSTCSMVKPWETNAWYVKHVLPGPPKGSSFCCSALLKELQGRIDKLKNLLAQCKPKPPDEGASKECKDMYAQLQGLEKALANAKGAQFGAENDKEEPPKTGIHAHDDKMTEAWDKNKHYLDYVKGNKTIDLGRKDNRTQAQKEADKEKYRLAWHPVEGPVPVHLANYRKKNIDHEHPNGDPAPQ